MKQQYVSPQVQRHGDITSLTRGGQLDLSYDGVVFHRSSGGGGGGGSDPSS